jgi:hypothetical protein
LTCSQNALSKLLAGARQAHKAVLSRPRCGLDLGPAVRLAGLRPVALERRCA